MTSKVMIGAAGTATGFGIVRTLASNWPGEVEIVVADVRPRRLIGAAAFADEYLQSPPVADDGYAEWLVEALRSSGADLFVPLIDADIVVAAEVVAGNRSLGARTSAPPLPSARICLDKLETYRWMSGAGIPTPLTWEPAEAPRDGRDLVLKARRGQGSVGFRALDSGADLEALDGDPKLVVQERCEPPEVTVDAFLAGDGCTFRAVCRERLETKAGVCTKARVFESRELSELAERIARGLRLGGFCMQVMRSPAGGWAVTDLNARVGAGARLSTAAGVDLLGAVYADLLDLDLDLDRALGRLDRDVYAVRQFDEYVID